nr:hypothetical protein [uncultured Roseateles sp.]
MKRRAILLASAGTALGTGCGSGPKQLGPPYYWETVESLAATKDWQRIVVFGERYDYELIPTKQLVELLTGPLRSRLSGDFRGAHLHADNSLMLNVRLVMSEQDMSLEELQRYRATSPQLPGRRVLFDQRLKFQRYRRAELDKSRLGSQSTNQKYVIDIVGDAETPATTLVSGRVIQNTPMFVLIPIALVFILLTQKGMPQR